MNRTAMKGFAIWARRTLIEHSAHRAGLVGVTETGISDPLPQSTQDTQLFASAAGSAHAIAGEEIRQRAHLAETIMRRAQHSDYPTAFHAVMEEVAYIWFVRLIAVRFMEVNGYLPARALSSQQPGKAEPDLITAPFDAGLCFSDAERALIADLRRKNLPDALFRLLFIKQCNALHAALPGLFQETDGYAELLFSLSYTDQHGVVARLTDADAMPEADFRGQVQIVGWLYQYYLSERREQLIDPLGGRKIGKADIPAATQLFTPDWVVRYLVDNSLGRYWIERNPQSPLRKKLRYLVPSQGGITPVDERIEPLNLTLLDPCVGSGHILAYAFDVLMEIYRECGYADRDAAVHIVQHNLLGLDIDDRACQLAYFTVMMKARRYHPDLLAMGIQPRVLAIQESNGLDPGGAQNDMSAYLIERFRDAKEIGSLQTVERRDYAAFLTAQGGRDPAARRLRALARQAEVLSGAYTAVVTNPPYLNKLQGRLKSFLAEAYAPYKGDLFSAFIYRNLGLCAADGYCAYMTPNVWMFIRTYARLRAYLLRHKSIVTLVQMAKGAFFREATVDVCAFVIANAAPGRAGVYIRLEDFRGGMDAQGQRVLRALVDSNCPYLYTARADSFASIPGMPIAYWASRRFLALFQQMRMSDVADVREGLKTGDNGRFIRKWYEVNADDIGILGKDARTAKWVAHTKGGALRKWYGNNEDVLYYESDGTALRHFGGASLTGEQHYFRESISWSRITSGRISFRHTEGGSIPNMAGLALYPRRDALSLLGYLNTPVVPAILAMTNPTLNYPPGTIAALPVPDGFSSDAVDNRVRENIQIAKADWDSFETSWDFQTHPLLRHRDGGNIAAAFVRWQREANRRFDILRANEEAINRIFIELCGLQAELAADVAARDVTVSRVYDRREDIPPDMAGSPHALTRADAAKTLISYAVGCMFGRYSPDTPGLIRLGSAHPVGEIVLPICDGVHVDDDITGRLISFIRAAFGTQALEENLRFLADALGGGGAPPQATLRRYFLRDFFKDHCRAYKKRPVYWLLDSGQHGGFKALLYMHRYDENTAATVRSGCLSRVLRAYVREIARLREIVNADGDRREATSARKAMEHLTRQYEEAKDYDRRMALLADARIAINLDDGVRANHERVQTDAEGINLAVLARIM